MRALMASFASLIDDIRQQAAAPPVETGDALVDAVRAAQWIVLVILSAVLSWRGVAILIAAEVAVWAWSR